MSAGTSSAAAARRCARRRLVVMNTPPVRPLITRPCKPILVRASTLVVRGARITVGSARSLGELSWDGARTVRRAGRFTRRANCHAGRISPTPAIPDRMRHHLKFSA